MITIAQQVRTSIAFAWVSEPTVIDKRARAFVASLAGALHVDDPQLAAEVFAMLLNVVPAKEAVCTES